MFQKDSLCFVPTRHRVQQGDAHMQHSSKCAPGLKTQYTQVIKTKQSLLLSPDWPWAAAF